MNEICNSFGLTIGKLRFAIKKNGLEGFLRAKSNQRPERCYSFEEIEKIKCFYGL